MFCYFCIVHLPGRPDREICVVPANDDAAALAELTEVARRWPGFETVVLYEGERVLAVVANPRMGFVAEPMVVDHGLSVA